MGTANTNCIATHNYEQRKDRTNAKITFEIPKLGHRKFA